MFRSVPFHRLSAPFGWESHPSSFGSDARSDSSHGRALPAARLVVEPACGRLLASCPPKRERCRVGTALRRLGLSASPWRGAVVRLDPADVILAIRASRLEPRGSPHPRLPVKAPEDDDFPFALRPDVRLVRVVDDRLALSTLARRERSRQLFLCNQQFSMSTRQLLRFPICWRRAFRSPPCPGFPLRGGKGRSSSYGRRITVAGECGLGWRHGWATPPIEGLEARGRDRRSRVETRRLLRGPHLLRARAESPRLGRPCSSPPTFFWNERGDQTSPPATHHVARFRVRSAFHRWVSPLRRTSSRHFRPGTRPPVASDMLFTRCAARQARLGLST